MKKIFTTAALVTGVFMSTQAQTPLPYYTGFDGPAQVSGWNFYKNAVNPNTEWSYENVFAYSTPSAVVHYYPVGGTQQTKDWCVSPAFDFSGGGKIDSLRIRFSGFNTPGTGDTIGIYLLAGSSDPAMASSRKLLMDFRGANYNANSTWTKFTNIAIPPTPGQTYIGFYYTTVISWMDVKIDNLQLSSPGSAPTASFSAKATACKDEPVVYSDLSTNTPTAWAWSFQGGTPATSSVKNPTVTYATPGTYTVSLVSTNSLAPSTAATKTVNISGCAGVPGSQSEEMIRVYPNPTHGVVTIQSGLGAAAFVLYTVSGEEVMKGQLEENGKATLDIRAQEKGFYFLNVESKTTKQTIRIVKE